MKARAVGIVAVVAALSAAAGAAYHLWSRGSDGASSRDLAEAVERVLQARVVDLQGASQSLQQWRGRVLVVNYWATWCAPCREEIPLFVRMQERYGERGLLFIGIAIDQPDKVAEFAREFRVNYPLVLGGVDSIEGVLRLKNVTGIEGVIIGRALYTAAIDLRELFARL